MSEELKPIRCGCGGEADVHIMGHEMTKAQYYINCERCDTRTWFYDTEAEAISAWNQAMGITHERAVEYLQITGWMQDHDRQMMAMGSIEKSSTVERTAKVIEHDASVTDTDGYKYHRTEYLCGDCKKRVLGGDEYCSHCGAKLIWVDEEDIPMEYFESGGK